MEYDGLECVKQSFLALYRLLITIQDEILDDCMNSNTVHFNMLDMSLIKPNLTKIS